MKKKLSILLILAIIGVGFLILNNRKREATQFADPAKMETPVAPKVGYKAPDFKLLDVQGNTVTLSQYLGKPVVVNFWATWCISCVEEALVVEKNYRNYSNKVEFLAINIGQDEASVKQYITENHLSYHFLLDKNKDAVKEYLVQALPITFIIDEQGIIRAVHNGVVYSEDFKQYFSMIGVSE